MNGLKRLRALGSMLEQMAAVRATVRVDGKPLWRMLLDIARQIEREQAEAVAWVREHGGLEPIKSSLSALELLAEGIEIDTGLAFYDESPKERCVALRNEVKSRLMPEGMEWPRTDDGKPVEIGDELIDDEDVHGWRLVDSIIFTNDGDGYLVVLENCRGATDSYSPGERVKRPAVLDADGRPLREGETAYDIEDAKGHPHTVASTELDGLGHVKTTCEEPTPASVSIHPSRLTHERPVVDTWERLEEDADRTTSLFDAFDSDASADIRDLVRRAKKLAGVE